MIPIKTQIKNRFDMASQTYESVAHAQKQSAELLIEKLLRFEPGFYPETILDIGTGTGYIPELLIPHYGKSLYTLNDIAPAMLEKTRFKFAAHNNFSFHIGDMETIDFKNHDLIISNFCLQWANNLLTAIKIFHATSKVFAFTCLLDKTFMEWQTILSSYGLSSVMKPYPAEQVLVSYCKELTDARFYFYTKDFQLEFSNAFSFIKYLKNLGAGISHTTIPINVLKALIADHRYKFMVTYKVFFGIIGDR